MKKNLAVTFGKGQTPVSIIVSGALPDPLLPLLAGMYSPHQVAEVTPAHLLTLLQRRDGAAFYDLLHG